MLAFVSLALRSLAPALLLGLGCGDDGPSTPAGETETLVSTGQASGSSDMGSTSSSTASSEGSSSSTESGSSSGSDEATPLAEFCEVAAAHVEMCGETLDACDRGSVEECTAVYRQERDELLAARAMCGFPDHCLFIAPEYEQRLCIFENTQDMEPTAAHVAIAEQLCTNCLPDLDGCIDDAFFRPEPIKGGSGVGGIGVAALEYVDPFVEQLASTCVPAPGTPACVDAFLACREDLLMQSWSPSLVEACDAIGG